MIFFVGNDGTIVKSDPSPVYQGAAGANDIYVVAPFAANLAASVAFKLPNGVWTTPAMLTPVGEIPQTINKATNAPYSGWKYSLPNEVTKRYGTVIAQFYFYPAQGGIITPTSYTSFEVGRGVSAQLPEQPTADIYSQILAALSQVQSDLANGYFAARALIGWHSTPFVYGNGEFVYYPEKGQNGTFLQSTKADNTTPPYNEQGELNSDAWKEIVNFDYISEQFFNTIRDLVSETGGYKTAAETAQQGALKAKEEAETAQSEAETAQRGAETAQQGALDAKTAAETAQTEALKAKSEAQEAQLAAETAQDNSEAADARAQEAAARAEEIYSNISNVYKYKGSVQSYRDLPLDGNEIGDVYDVREAYDTYPAGTNFAWTGTAWDALGGLVDLTPLKKGISDNAQAIADETARAKGVEGGLNTRVQTIEDNYIPKSQKGANNGVASLGEDGKVPSSQLPDLSGAGVSSTVVEYASSSTSSSTPPQEGWSSELPVFQAGQFLWTRLTITYTDGKQTVFYSVSVTVTPTKTSDLQNDGNGTSPFATKDDLQTTIENAIIKALNTPV